MSKRYGSWGGGVAVLDGVDLDLAPGTLTLLTGANGAGKSTLLRIIAGATLPTTGSVSGRPRDLGYAPDRLGASGALTARQYLARHGHLHRLSSHATATRAEELCAKMYFTRELDTRIDRLSKGNSRKLAIAQAMLSLTRLLVLDEPFAGLDQRTVASLNELLQLETGEGNTVILSDHELRSAVPADEHVELVTGRLHSPDSRPTRPATPTSIIRLKPPASATVDELARLAGVLSAKPIDQGQVIVLVDRARTDAFLNTVLTAGWSVLTVAEGPQR